MAPQPKQRLPGVRGHQRHLRATAQATAQGAVSFFSSSRFSVCTRIGGLSSNRACVLRQTMQAQPEHEIVYNSIEE
eukprot:7325242-Prymnesium_polylepis.1